MNAMADGLSQFASVWAGMMLLALWQSALVALLIMAVVACLRRSSSPLRYGLLMVALIKFAIPPMLALPTGLFSRVEVPPAVVKMAPASARNEPILPPNQFVSTLAPAQSLPPQQSAMAPAWTTPTGVEPSTAPAKARPFPTIPLAAWLMLAHALGAIGVTLWIAWQMLALGRVAHRATRLTGGPAHALYLTIATSLGLRRVPRLLILESGCAPVAFGVFRPVVLIPRRLIENFDPGQLRAVLGHELAHHRRRDPLVIMIQLILLIVWWFNPVYWLVVRTLRKVREDCCDDLLLARELTSNEAYCETLLRTGRELTHALPAGAALGFAESIHPLARRLRRIMDADIRRSWQLSLIGLIALIGLAALVLPGTRPRAQAIAPPAKPSATIAGNESRSQAMLSGRITDEDGRPLKGIHVEIAAIGVRIERTETGADGVYSFSNVAPAEYRIKLESVDYVRLQHRDAPSVVLAANSRVVHDFKLRRACKFELRVVNESGNPVIDAQISVDRTDTAKYMGNQTFLEKTDGTGFVRVGGIPSSGKPYLIMVTHREYAPAYVPVNLNDAGKVVTQKIVMTKGLAVKGHAVGSDNLPIAGWTVAAEPDWWQSVLTPGDYPIDNDGNFVLEHVTPGKYSIFINVPDGNNGYARHPVLVTGLPLKGGLLEIKAPLPSPKSSASISGTISLRGHELKQGLMVVAVGPNSVESTDVDGGQNKFTVSNLKPGVYDLQFQSPEIKFKVVKGVKAPSSGLNVELEYLGIPKVRGVVVNAATSKPLATYQVRVRKVRSFDDYHVPDGRWQSVSNPDGRFELEMVGPGVFQVQAMAEGLAPRWSAEFDTRIDGDKMLRIELTPGASAKGKVLDQQGKPIAGAKIIPLSRASGVYQDELDQFKTEDGAVATGADGSFAFEHLTPGDETFKVVHPGHSPVEMNNIKLKEGEVTVIAARKLTNGGTVQGRVYNNEGKPQPGVNLEIRNAPGMGSGPGLLAMVVTDASGAYRAGNLPDGLVYVQREDQWNCSGVTINAILVANDQAKTLDLGGGGIVTGRLVENSKPLSGTIMNIHSDAPYGGTFTSIAQTDNEGKFTLTGVPAGRRTLYYIKSDEHRGAPIELKSFDFDPKITPSLDLGEVSRPRAVVRIKVVNEDPATTYSAQRVSICTDRENEIGGRVYGWIDPIIDPNAPIIVRGVPPGKYAASVMRGDLVAFREFFSVGEGASDLDVTIRMPRGTSALHAHYLDTKPRLIVMRKDRRVFGFITPDQANNSLSRLPAGRYLIHNISFDSLRPVKEVTLPPGETLMMNIEEPWFATPTKGMLDVQVFTSEGMPLPGAKVWLESEGEKTEPQQIADHHHFFTAKAGGCTIHAGYPHFRAVEFKSVLPPVFESLPRKTPTARIMLERE